MFRKLFIALVALAFLAVPVGTASAGPPEDFDVPDLIQLFLDADEGKSVWINITAPDFCLWALGGFMGPAPVVDDAVPAKLNFIGQGDKYFAPSVKVDGLYVEVWNLDNPDGPFLGPCEDILGQLIAGTPPWATGTTSINARSNNFEFPPPQPRAVSGGFSGTALLDATGSQDSYRYHFNSHSNDRCADFRCAVTNTSLRLL